MHVSKLFYTLLRVSFRLFLGRKKRDEFLTKRNWQYSDKTIRDLVFYLCQMFHTTFLFRLLPHEKDVTKMIRKIKGKIFVDVGANYGFYSLLLHKNFERIIAVEPHPSNVEKIKESLVAMKVQNIEVVQKAISDEDNQFLPLFMGVHDGGHSLISNHRLVPLNHNCILVETVTLSSLLRTYKQVDLVKVDVEGAEWGVLKGAQPILSKVIRWVVELHNPKRKRELEEWFISHGYSVRWLDFRGKTANHIYAWKHD